MRSLKDAEEIKEMANLILIMEKIVKKRRLDKESHKRVMEMKMLKLLKGEDPLDPYERRDFGVNDEIWERVFKKTKVFLGLEKSDERPEFFTF